MIKGHKWLWREYYAINRATWPGMGRVAAGWDALRLAVKVWKVTE